MCSNAILTDGIVWLAVSGFPDKGDPRFLESAWRYSVGRLTQEMAKEHLFPPAKSTLALFCGPQPMILHACRPFCLGMGYDESSLVTF